MRMIIIIGATLLVIAAALMFLRPVFDRDSAALPPPAADQAALPQPLAPVEMQSDGAPATPAPDQTQDTSTEAATNALQQEQQLIEQRDALEQQAQQSPYELEKQRLKEQEDLLRQKQQLQKAQERAAREEVSKMPRIKPVTDFSP